MGVQRDIGKSHRFGWTTAKISWPGFSFDRSGQSNESASKDLLRSFFPAPVVIEGLGIELARSSSPDQKRDLVKAKVLKDQSQLEMPWKPRLELAALISKLTLDSSGLDHISNSKKIQYLKSVSKLGDIIFVTGGGKRQGAFSELIDLATRVVSSRTDDELSFPFTHVMVNMGDGTLRDLNVSGPRRQTWEQVLEENSYYDCIAVGSLQCSDKERQRFVAEVEKTAQRLTKYNMPWVLLRAPFEVRSPDTKNKDTSVEGNLGVCTDYITESAKVLAKVYPHFEILSKAVNPFRLFENNGIRIAAALNFDRE